MHSDCYLDPLSRASVCQVYLRRLLPWLLLFLLLPFETARGQGDAISPSLKLAWWAIAGDPESLVCTGDGGIVAGPCGITFHMKLPADTGSVTYLVTVNYVEYWEEPTHPGQQEGPRDMTGVSSTWCQPAVGEEEQLLSWELPPGAHMWPRMHMIWRWRFPRCLGR
ncbi:MAG TPA: hypothetical protein EYP85_08060 [Armatimonadetes bacterium]|nr:hypothetical protein [Armatimonadota bacterium]